jgi:hypothetical protein
MRPRCIPPITSTGKNRRKTPVLLNGLAHMSLGRYMSEMAKNRKNGEDYESWSVTKYAKSEFNRKSNKKPISHFCSDSDRKIGCLINTFDDYNEEGDFAISLQFDGIEFLSDVVTTYSDEPAQCSFLLPVSTIRKEKESYLLLTTIGDIFEYEVVRNIQHCCIGDCFMGHSKKAMSKTGEKEFCPNRLFRGEAYIPELMTIYDSTSMHVVLKNNCVIVTYKKN